jgi:phage tail sheath protein FI
LSKVVDEIHVAVIDSDGSFTGTAGTVLEKYEGLSLFTDAKTENGATNYYREVINRASNYIYINKLKDSRITSGTAGVVEGEFAVTDVTALSAITTPLGAKASTGGVTITLTGGANVAMTPTGMSTAYDLFADSQSVDIGLLFGEVHQTTATAVTNDAKLSAIVNARKDCVGFISAPMSITGQSTDTGRFGEITTKLGTTGCPVSSYIVMDSSPVYVYNKYNDNYLYIPACGHVAGLCANTDAVADAWFSPAGFNRGQLQDVVKLAYNPNQADRDALYTQGVNPISAFPGQGVVLYGDKTRLAKPSAFDRINVRRLFITLEKAIANASKFQLFEQNDEFTRAAFKNIVEPYLRDVQGRRGITDFRVVCDATNNTGQVIDSNSFVADIYIKPTRSINFITLNFIATRTGVEFKTIVGA